MAIDNAVSRRSFLKLSSVVAAGLGLTACGGGSGDAASTDSTSGDAAASTTSGSTFMIGGIGPVTGAAAIYGSATKFGAQVAVDEVNAAGNIQMELNWQDDEHDAEKSVNAYNTLKDWGMQILVGTTTTTPCVAVSTETYADRIFELTPSASSVNVIGGFQVTQQACNRFFMKQASRGVVVFLSSNTAMRAIRRRTAYCASKGAVNSMVRALALDLAPLGIRVNCCAPGYINTERWDSLDPKIAARRRLNCPLRREARGADIANVVAFLASDDSSNMTGEIVTCDAGCSCQYMPEDLDL